LKIRIWRPKELLYRHGDLLRWCHFSIFCAIIIVLLLCVVYKVAEICSREMILEKDNAHNGSADHLKEEKIMNKLNAIEQMMFE
jgi:hypothetical protein